MTDGRDNLFPNSQFQLTTALGPGFNGDSDSVIAHLASFDTEWASDYSGPVPTSTATRLDVSTDPSSGQATVTVHGDAAVRHLYPDAIVVFDSAAPEALRISPMRVRSVDYIARTWTVYPPRNKVPPSGGVRCGVRQVMRADMTGVTGHGPDGWSKTVSAQVWLDRWRPVPVSPTDRMRFTPQARPAWTSHLRPSTKRCVVLKPADAAATRFFHRMQDFETLRGRQIVFGMWVDRTAGGSGRLFIEDGAEHRSARTVSSPGWTWIEMTHIVSETATGLDLGVVVEGSAGAPWRLCEPVLKIGASLGLDGYRRPKGHIERFVVKITPDAWFGADFTFGAQGGCVVDFAGETALAIAEDIPLVFGQLEGTPMRAGLPLFTRSQFPAPHRYGAALHGGAAGLVVSGAAPFDLADDHTLWLFSEPNAQWSDVSFDLNQAILW